MVRAINKVMQGGKYFSADIAEQLASSYLSDNQSSPFDALSEREMQVAMMVVNCISAQEISDKLGRGRHTTRHVELFEVYDGLIADTPGFSSLDYEIDNQPDLNAAFPEILRQSFGCKFRECTHTHEPKCQVKPAVAAGDILQSRYDNYLLFLTEIQGKRETYKKVVKK